MKSPPEDLSEQKNDYYNFFREKSFSRKNGEEDLIDVKDHAKEDEEDMFKTCRICTTMKIHSEKAKFQSLSLAFQDILTSTLLLSLHYYTIHHNIITIL